VADEVRSLAKRTAEAARNTADLLENTIGKVREGSTLIEKTSNEFFELTMNVSKIGGLVGEIAGASREQAQGIAQISKAVEEMNIVVQKNASSSEETAASAEELSSQAEEMLLITSDFDQMIYGRRGARARLLTAGGAGWKTAQASEADSGVRCWEVMNCPGERRGKCPAYPEDGNGCWTVTGTLCGGKMQGSYKEKMAGCRRCDVYRMVKGQGEPEHKPGGEATTTWQDNTRRSCPAVAPKPDKDNGAGPDIF